MQVTCAAYAAQGTVLASNWQNPTESTTQILQDPHHLATYAERAAIREGCPSQSYRACKKSTGILIDDCDYDENEL
eukprot:8552637-Lingulodinium_polyedra.AAC.1